MNVDVAIIGSGPGGGAAACHLANSGFSVVILEQHQLPRPKACGGLVPLSALKLLPFDVSPFIAHTVVERSFRFNHRDPCERRTPHAELAIVDRAEFDAGLVELAIEMGGGRVVLCDDYRVEDVVENRESVIVSSYSGQQVEAKYLLAADGAASPTARRIGLNCHRTTAAGIDLELRVTESAYSDHASRVLFDYYSLPVGYGWIFPKTSPFLSVGVAAWPPGNPSRKAMDEFLEFTFAESEIVDAKYRAHAIPVFTGEQAIASSRVCLVGDAASLVHPVTGEGIRYALESGLIAAQTVHQLLNQSSRYASETLDCRRYQKKIQASIGRKLDRIYRFCALPFRDAPEFYYRNFVVSGGEGSYK